MVDFEEKDGELYIKVANFKDIVRSPKTTVCLTVEAAHVIEEICERTGIKPKQAASELILFASAHVHIKKTYDPDDWRSRSYKDFELKDDE